MILDIFYAMKRETTKFKKLKQGQILTLKKADPKTLVSFVDYRYDSGHFFSENFEHQRIRDEENSLANTAKSLPAVIGKRRYLKRGNNRASSLKARNAMKGKHFGWCIIHLIE